MTRLCVSIFVESIDQAKRDMARAAEAGADIVELRVDLFRNIDDLRRLLAQRILPCIVTCRPTWEGGLCEAFDAERVDLLMGVMDARYATADFIDVEQVTRQRNAICRATGSVIASYHDFEGRPHKLYGIMKSLNAGAPIVKIAWMARSVRDNLEAFELLLTRQRPTIALCMGEAGLISRILAKKFGAFLTFASLRKEDITAPGQPTIDELKNLYRWDAIQPTTKVFGVVGSPIAHSMSPAVHNAAFDATGYDGVYVPLLVEPSYESFKAFMETFVPFDRLDLTGLSITIPHKENALRYLKEKVAEIDGTSERIGAVNTIDIRNGVLRGFNTDHHAILDSITSTLNITHEQLREYRVAVIGAGGTGRTAVAALAGVGATVVVYNRTHERAEALAAEFNGKSGKVVAARMEKLCDSCCQIYINTTSVGMHPNVDVSPIDASAPKFGPDTLVFDTIYNPIETKLLRTARETGAKTLNGADMFVRQAAMQFSLWTERAAPIDVMRNALDRRLQMPRD